MIAFVTARSMGAKSITVDDLMPDWARINGVRFSEEELRLKVLEVFRRI